MMHKVIKPRARFQGQHTDESIEVVLRRHVFFLVIGYLFILILAMISIGLYLYLPSVFPFLSEGVMVKIYQLILLYILLILFYLIFLTWAHYYLDAYIVTNERLLAIDQIDFFHRKVAEADVGNVEDVEVIVKGFFATLIDFGDIRIQTAGADSRTLFFNDVPNPYQTKNLILNLSEKNRTKELHNAYTYRPSDTSHSNSSDSI